MLAYEKYTFSERKLSSLSKYANKITVGAGHKQLLIIIFTKCGQKVLSLQDSLTLNQKHLPPKQAHLCKLEIIAHPTRLV